MHGSRITRYPGESTFPAKNCPARRIRRSASERKQQRTSKRVYHSMGAAKSGSTAGSSTTTRTRKGKRRFRLQISEGDFAGGTLLSKDGSKTLSIRIIFRSPSHM